jgi:hypothetical protein
VIGVAHDLLGALIVVGCTGRKFEHGPQLNPDRKGRLGLLLLQMHPFCSNVLYGV